MSAVDRSYVAAGLKPDNARSPGSWRTTAVARNGVSDSIAISTLTADWNTSSRQTSRRFNEIAKSLDPSAGFDTLGYLAADPDVAAAHVPDGGRRSAGYQF